jgi:hypothetical protein
VGTLDMAVWDAVAKIEGKPLFRLLAERHQREANPRVFVYAAGGYYAPEKAIETLRVEMRRYVDWGYRVVKMKIGGASIDEDERRIEAVLEEISSEAQLAVDANGRFDLETAVAYTPKCCASIRYFGSKRRAIRSITNCKPRWRSFIRVRWRREKIYSATRTREIFCAMPGYGQTGTGCSSIARFPTGSANISARWK